MKYFKILINAGAGIECRSLAHEIILKSYFFS